MMLNHTSRSGSQNGVMSGDMADNTANGGAFQASFGGSHAGQQRKTDANGDTGSNLAHFLSPGDYRYPKYTRLAQNCTRQTSF
jgi:hypothetical protein